MVRGADCENSSENTGIHSAAHIHPANRQGGEVSLMLCVFILSNNNNKNKNFFYIATFLKKKCFNKDIKQEKLPDK